MHSLEYKEIHTFPKGIYPKVNILAWLEFELAYYDPAVQRFNHYTTRMLPNDYKWVNFKILQSQISFTFMYYQVENV